MKIEIRSARFNSIEDMTKSYPQLCEFGFEIEKEIEPQIVYIKDMHDKERWFEYGCTCKYIPYIHISTIEELFKLGSLLDANLVIHDDQQLIVIHDTLIKY